MKKLLFIIALLLPLALSAQQQTQATTQQTPQAIELAQVTDGKVDVYLFTAPTCSHCIKFKNNIYPALQKKFKNKVNFHDLSTDVDGNNLKLINMAEKYAKQPAVPALVVGNTYLLGYQELDFYSEQAINKAIDENQTTAAIGDVNVEESFKKITLAAILFNGLVDGVNPCAFAVIVFFVSFLTVYGYSRREVMFLGTAYCLAVFLTYVGLGFGLFKILYALEPFIVVIKAFYILTAAICFIFFGLSIYDFIIYTKTKDSKTMLLQLPANLKTKINKIIGFFLRDKSEKSVFRLFIAAFCVGVAVSLVEAVCTGQVYIPTIVLIMKQPEFRLEAILYLLIYNLMFIAPLLLVFVLAALGYKSDGFNTFFKKHLGITKLLLSLVFLGLGLMLVFN